MSTETGQRGKGIYIFPGDPTGAPISVIDPPMGSIILDATGGNPSVKNSPVGDNSAFGRLLDVDNLAEEVAASDVEMLAAIRSAMGVPKPGRRRVALFGDSITDMNGGPRLDGTYQNHQPTGYWTWASIFTRHSFDLVINAGISGDNTTSMAARFEADALSASVDIVVFLGGINDVLGVSGGNRAAKVATVKTNITTILDKAEAKGVIVVVIPTLPVAPAYGLTTEQRIAQAEINQWLRQRARTRSNTILADCGAALADDTQLWQAMTTGVPTREYLTDGLHPAAAGAMLMGRVLADAVRVLAWNGNLLTAGNGDYTNLLPNGSFRGSIADADPTSWTVNELTGDGSYTLGYADRDDGIAGQWLVLTLTGGMNVVIYQTGLSSGFAVGDVLKASLEFAAVSISGTTSRSVLLQLSTHQPNSTVIKRMTEAGDDNPLTGVNAGYYLVSPRSGVLETPPVEVTNGASYLETRLFVFGDGVYRLGSAAIVTVTPP